MEGYPGLMKEIAEIVEMGSLEDFTIIDYISSLKKYSSIQ